MKRDFYKLSEQIEDSASVVLELSASQLSILICNDDGLVIGYAFYSTAFKLSDAEYIKQIETILQNLKTDIPVIREVKLFFDHSRVSLIPAEFFNSDEALAHFRLQHGSVAKNAYLNIATINDAVVAVFEFKEPLKLLIENILGHCSIHHSYAAQASTSFCTEDISLIFHKHYFNICVHKNNDLQIVRSFQFENEADVLYHIMNTLNQLKIDASECTVAVCGAIDQSSGLYKTMHEFLRNLEFLHVENESTSNEIPNHYFYHLIQFRQCVS